MKDLLSSAIWDTQKLMHPAISGKGTTPGLFQLYQGHSDLLKVQEKLTSMASFAFNP